MRLRTCAGVYRNSSDWSCQESRGEAISSPWERGDRGGRRKSMLARGLRRLGFRIADITLAALLGLLGGGIKVAAQAGSPMRASRARGTRALMDVARVGAEDKPDPRSEIGGLHSKFVDLNGVKARYYEAGAGEPMVMIPRRFTAGAPPARTSSRKNSRTLHRLSA